MKPENTQRAVPGFEQVPMQPSVGPEAVPVLPRPEGAPLAGGERVEQAAEARAMVADAAAAVQQAVPVMPAAAPTDAPTAVDNTTASATPLVAADEDLIEKEWVDKAKQIIEQTKDDPHTRTQRVNELQRDYLQKRFGKVVGAGE